MGLKALHSGIIFQFNDDTSSSSFGNSSKAGIIIPNGIGGQVDIPRYGKVTSIGPKVLDVKIGDYILIEPGKWTPGLKYNEQTYWKTEEKFVIGVTNEFRKYEL